MPNSRSPELFRLPYPRRLESAPWFAVAERLDGPSARERVLAVRGRVGKRPYCVYVHVPFCSTICRFCALYTFGVSLRDDQVFDTYLEFVQRSLARHPWAGAVDPPTTVHFGGGTPLALGLTRFARLVRSLVDAFGTSPRCEWAIETTTSSLDAETVATLAALGFNRIHLGIQTLDDATRTRIGRRESGEAVTRRVRSLQDRGFFTSADLIIGFDGTDSDTVEDDLRRLYDAGVRMFSICELRENGRARLGHPDGRGGSRLNYASWKAIWRFMEEMGLVPIHLGQFARRPEDNLYFTHPARGEDCVAIGPYAHGSVEDVYYGNHLLPDYYEAIAAGLCPIAMAVDYQAGERVIRALETELLAHRVRQSTFDAVLESFPETFEAVLTSWLEHGLLREAPSSAFALTADGSWFVGNMIEEARGMIGVA